MTAALGFEVRRRAPLSGEELRRQLLALVLAAVLVWYTVVVPSHSYAGAPSRLSPEDEGRDGEVREAAGAAPPRAADSRPDGDDLDWPEYIYP